MINFLTLQLKFCNRISYTYVFTVYAKIKVLQLYMKLISDIFKRST